MLLPLGSVSGEAAKDAFLNKDYSAYPPAMAEAIREAEETFAATANPQKIDFIIDRACFADMLWEAKKTGVALAERLVRVKIDLVNIMQALRISRMGLAAQTASILSETYIEGGSIDKECFLTSADDSESFIKEIMRSDFYSVADMISNDATLGAIEKKADDIYMDIAKKAKEVPFGLEVAIGYLTALEYEVKNIRIILAGKTAGADAEVIRERLRECYV